MDNAVVLWLVGALVGVVTVGVAVWSWRRRDGDVTDPHRPAEHTYAAPEIVTTGGTAHVGVTFGEGADDAPVDETIPRTRLGGAGGRDTETTSRDRAAVADETGSVWPETGSAEGDGTRHVEVDQTGPRPAIDHDADRRRGGHW